MKRIIRSILVALFTPIILLLILVLLGTMCLILLIEYAFKTEKEESDGQIFCLKLEQSSCISSKSSTVKLFTIKIP
jgi:hypothetical protein